MGGKNASNPVESIAGIQAIFKYFQDIPAKDLKGITDDLKKTISSGIVVVTSTYEDKVSLVVGVTHDLTPTISAVDLAKVASQTLGGQGGGGRPDMAQAGGTNPEAVAKIQGAIAEFLENITAKP